MSVLDAALCQLHYKSVILANKLHVLQVYGVRNVFYRAAWNADAV